MVIDTSILIATRNGAEEIGSCLDAVYSQTGVGRFEVVVVDSGSTDGTLEIARRYPACIHEIRPEEFHHAKTRNYLAELARGELLVFLSQDAVPACDEWLRALAENFRDPQVGAAYGRQLPKPGSGAERLSTFAALYGEKRIVKEPQDGRELGHAYYHFSDANSAIRKVCWQATRFPEDLRVFEDVAIAKRILDSGWRIIYEPNAPVYHSHEFSTGTLFRRYFDIGVVYEHLGIWTRGSRSSLWRAGWRGLRSKIGSVSTNKDGLTLALSVVQDVGKYAAIQLGRNHRLLPPAVRRKLSLYRLFD